MKEDTSTEKDMVMELIVLEILPNMLESILGGEDTDMEHFGIQVSRIILYKHIYFY